jgi:hypothetical protein
LNDSSFEIGAFKNITGSVRLDLSNNQISYLNEQVFAPFLIANQDNKIILFGNPMNCSDCRSYWLFKNKKWKAKENKINSLDCYVNYTNIWENEEELKGCGNYSITQTLTPMKYPINSVMIALFSLVGLLIMIIIGLSIFVGFFVWRKKKKENIKKRKEGNTLRDSAGNEYYQDMRQVEKEEDYDLNVGNVYEVINEENQYINEENQYIND